MVSVNAPGEPRRRLTATFDRERDAKKWLMIHQGQRLTGVVRPEKVNTADFLRGWLDGPYVTRLTGSTQRQYRQVVESYIIPSIGKVALANLTPSRIGQMLADLAKPDAAKPKKPGRTRKDETLSPRTIALTRATLRAALRPAVENGLISVNPAAAAPLPHRGTSAPKHRALTTEELSRLLVALDQHKPRIGPLVTLAFASGLRLGELLGLDLTDVDEEARVLHVRGSLGRRADGLYELRTVAKTEKSIRTVHLGQMALQALKTEGWLRASERLKAGTAWHGATLVFCSSVGTALSPRNVSRSWHELCDLAEIDRRPFHHLRHSYATELLNGGLELERVSKLLGHTTIDITARIYADVREHLTAPSAPMIDQAQERARKARK